jgi:hypothetical protein
MSFLLRVQPPLNGFGQYGEYAASVKKYNGVEDGSDWSCDNPVDTYQWWCYFNNTNDLQSATKELQAKNFICSTDTKQLRELMKKSIH